MSRTSSPPWLHLAAIAQVTLQHLSLCGTEMPTMNSIGRLIFRYIWESEVPHYPKVDNIKVYNIQVKST